MIQCGDVCGDHDPVATEAKVRKVVDELSARIDVQHQAVERFGGSPAFVHAKRTRLPEAPVNRDV